MSTKSPLEHCLFWLCIVLKVAFWAALVAGLVKGIWTTAMGRDSGSPLTLVWIVLTLAILQLCAWLAWALVRRARLRRDAR